MCQGDSEEICELEVEGTGLVQIFREGEEFAGRIEEHVGPFSRITTVPLYCSGFCDPRIATRNLARLPQSAVRHRIHILSDPARRERFIFVGDLGLRGGGDREPPSSSYALRHRTPAESSASRSLTGSALTPTERSLVRKILNEGSYQTLEQAVEAFNDVEDAEQKRALEVVIRKVLRAFGDMHVEDATKDRGSVVRECLALCRLDSATGEHLPLLKDFFGSVRDKLCGDAPNNRYLMEAIELALQSVEAEMFEDDPSCLVRLSEFLLDSLDPEKTSFSRETFPVQCSALHAAHECLRLLRDAGSADWDPNEPEGLCAKLEDSCRRVIEVAGYYPMKFQAVLVQHGLTCSQSSKRGVRYVSNARRIAGILSGTEGVHQAVRKAIHLDFDLGDAESVTRALQQAMLQALRQASRSKIVSEEQCRTYLHSLNTAYFAAMEDPSALEVFSELLSSLVLEGRTSDREQCKVLRFSVVEMLNMLSVHGKDEDVRKSSAETLASLVEPTDEWDWSSDPDLFLELLDNLAELSVRGYENEKRAAQDAMEKLVSNVHNAACGEALTEWREEKAASDTLFSRVWKSLEKELSPPETGVRFRRKKDHSLFSPYIVWYFAGRSDELNEIVEAFASSDESVVVKAIVGPGGIGKTQLAIRAFDLFRSKRNYDNEFWIPSSSRESLTATFLQIAEYLKVPRDDDAAKVIRSVQENLGRSRCLYVFDDAPDLELIREYVPPTGAHVIVTTRECGSSEWERDAVRLEPFDEIEARILAERFECAKSLKSRDLDDLMDLLPRTPLALAQFFSLMKDEDLWRPAEWAQRLLWYRVTEREAETIAKLSATRVGEDATGMVFVFNTSMKRISEEPNDLGPPSLDVLAKLALLDPNGVPIEWVYKWHEHGDVQSRTKTQNSVRLLERFSHVSWDKQKNQIYMHAETQLLVKHLLLNTDHSTFDKSQESDERNKSSIEDHIKTIVHSIGRYTGEWRTDRSNRELWTSLALNGLTLLEDCVKCKDTDVELKLLGHMSRAYREISMFRESLSYCQRALEMCERLHGDADHPDLVSCISNYAVGLGKTGRINEALPVYKRALEMCERQHGDADHPDLVSCLKDYADGLSRVGREKEALPFRKRALEMCERLHGDADHPDLVACIGNYAVGLEKTGRINEALPVYKKALDMCERLHGDGDHPDLQECIRNYAVGLLRVGREKEALLFFKRALEMCERLHGDADHPDLERCIRNYAAGLGKTGRINEELPLLKKALEMCERLHGDADHPDLVACIGNYAVGLEKTGRINEALLVHKKALEMRERLYGDADHPDLALSIRNYAVGLLSVGREKEALPFCKRALEMCERLHGDADHPDLVACIGNYAVSLSTVGRENEALVFRKRALEMCERLYGDADHPDLVACIGNYAVSLSTVGRENEALVFRKRALEMCERLYGDADHPDLALGIGIYAAGLSKVGRKKEALVFRKRALEMCERLYGGADHPDLALDIRLYAVELERSGRINEALPVYKRALDMCERLHGDADHPDLVTCIRNYANCLTRMGKDHEALLYLERVDKSPDHPGSDLSVVCCLFCCPLRFLKSHYTKLNLNSLE